MPSAFRSLPEPLRTPRALAFDREARRLFAGFDDGSVAEWTLASGIRRKVVTGRPGPVTSLAASPDGGELVVSAPGGLTAFDATSFEVRREWPLVAESDAMAYSPDGRWFAYADRVEFPSIVIVDRRRGTEARRLNGLPRPVESLAFSPDGKRLAATSYDRTVRLWDLETGAPTAIFREHSHWTTAVAWSDDGSYLVSGSADGTLRFRRVRRQGTAVAR